MGNVKGLVGIIGVSTKGQTLTLETDGLSDENGLGTLTYQWIRGTTNDAVDNEDIPGATSATYKLTSADVGKDISVKVSYTDDGGTAENITSSTVYAASNAPTGAFSEDTTQSLGSANSQAITLGDVDGDGDLDMVVANDGANKVYTNDGSGAFEDSTQSLGSAWSQSITLGDIDGDGDLDMVVANFGGANKVYTNNGTGSFEDSDQSLGGTARSRGITLGDIDGDGDLDMVVANDGANKVYTNDGSGAFEDSGTSLGSANSTNITLGDIDGDGDLDMVVANYNQANKVWLNNGTGAFSEDKNQALGLASSEEIALGDIDGDGDLDMVVANYNQANKVWLNNGTGAFSEDKNQALGLASSEEIALGDIDGDGDLDMVVANVGGANKVYTNNGSGSFEDSTQTLGSRNSMDITLGDIDGDGDLDMVVANSDGEANKVYFNNSAPRGIIGIEGVSTAGQTLTAITAGLSDAEGLGALTYQWIRGTTVEGAVDVSIPGATNASYTLTQSDVTKDISVRVSYTDGGGTAENITSSTVYAASNAPTGVFTDSTQSLGSSSSSNIILGDLNNDGHLDMVVANASNGEDSKIWINDGTGTFTEKTETDLGSSQAIAVGDLDGDGDLDMFIGMFGAPDRIWENDGTGSFTVDDDLLGGSGYALNATLGDIDGDGDLDILVAEGGVTKLFVNEGSLTFTDSNQDFYSEGDYIVGITLGDVNGDGYLDAIVASASSDNKILFNNAVTGGPGTFYNRESGDIGSRVRSIATGDIDGDGDLDIVTTTSSANKVYFNEITQGTGTVTGTFTASEQSLGSANSQSVSLEDMDGDGDLDMVVANLGANKVYLNNGSGTFEDSGQSYESEQSNGIGIGDLDRDGDLDLVVANNFDYVDDSSKANKVYFNNSAPRGIIGIEGVSTAGQTLTAITDGLSDADGLGTLTYQWIRGTTVEGAVDVSIPGATNASYTLTQSDVKKDISVKVSYTDNEGTAENITSSTVYAASNTQTGVFTDSTQTLGGTANSQRHHPW